MHLPVLKNEVIEYLDPKPNENFIDGTLGQGGHTRAILEKTGPRGKVLAIDLDPKLIENCRSMLANFGQRLILVNDNFTNLKRIIERENFKAISGILLDLGFSSWHLEKSKRGFSFKRDERLDMRYNDKNPNFLTALEILNNWPQKELERILREYSQERWAKKIAKEITKQRKKEPIETTFQLVKVIKKAIPKKYRQKRKRHFSTKTFLALRIAVNRELENLKKILPQAFELLSSGGKLAVISFHSLEDRVVKNFFKEKAKEIKILTKKPITPTLSEQKLNPRARSAKLRVLEKI